MPDGTCDVLAGVIRSYSRSGSGHRRRSFRSRKQPARWLVRLNGTMASRSAESRRRRAQLPSVARRDRRQGRSEPRATCLECCGPRASQPAGPAMLRADQSRHRVSAPRRRAAAGRTRPLVAMAAAASAPLSGAAVSPVSCRRARTQFPASWVVSDGVVLTVRCDSLEEIWRAPMPLSSASTRSRVGSAS
jgi:hypothetical protein